MKIIGVNFSHDSSLCYIEDGIVRYAIEEEKISRVKQDFGWPKDAWNDLSTRLGIKAAEIDAVVFGSESFLSIAKNEIKYRFSKNDVYRNLEIISRLTAYLNLSTRDIGESNKSVFHDELRKQGFINAEIHFYNHHMSHAASAYYCAPFDSEMVVTCDGHGDGESFVFYKHKENEGLSCFRSNDFTTSVGQFYSCITQLLGYKPTRHEGKITGLAAYGENSELVEKFRSLFYYKNDVLCRFPEGQVDAMAEKYTVHKSGSLKDKINWKTAEYGIGHQYALNSKILLAWLKEETKESSKENIAYACQLISEEVIVNEVERAYKENYAASEKINVCLAGGVFANVRINQKISELDWVGRIFVQPAMGDSGLAMGGALLADIKYRKNELADLRYSIKNAYFGPDYTDEVDEFLKSIDTSIYTVIKMDEPAKEVANLIYSDRIVGFWSGPMEWGPRALGSRSIILNTFNREVNDTLNERLERTEFMPFAPSVVDYRAMDYFPKYSDDDIATKYMTVTFDVKEEYRDELQAVTHIDGTARPQIVSRKDNAYYYDVISEFEKLSGCGAVVNTSFNAHEEPIVSSPAVALNALLTERVDCLVLNDYLLTKSIHAGSEKV